MNLAAQTPVAGVKCEGTAEDAMAHERVGGWGCMRSGTALSLAAMALAGLALWSWAAQVADILTFSPKHIPMAPSTALVVGFLGLALYLSICRFRPGAAVRRLVRLLAAVAWATGVLVCLRHALGWNSPLETWLAQTDDSVDGIPLGQMSPLTAAALMAVALSILAAPREGAAPSPFRRGIAAGLAAVALVAGLVVAGSYALDRKSVV